MRMSFEEEFPSLITAVYDDTEKSNWFQHQQIQKYCLDKQRVKEARIKLSEHGQIEQARNEYFKSLKNQGQDVSTFNPYDFMAVWHIAQKALLKELGL